ncbi:MAG: carbohydrate kinase family protein [Anaerolineaceae bacterium]|jgi:fructokinase|nr:MAG: carbohydrate kinase family protein [Anaerolineaceae bacterium]
MAHRACVLGDPAVDLIVHMPEIRDGEKVMVHHPNLYPGGSGGNTAVALARLGISTQFIGTIGDDQYGQIVKEDFMQENVEITQLFVDPALSTVCVFAFVESDGERYLWGWPRTNQSYTSIAFDRINLDLIRHAGWLHTTGLLLAKESTGRDTTLKALEWANNNEVITSLDLNLRVSGNSIENTYREIVMRAISNSKFILGSEQEFSILHETHDWEQSAASIEQMHKIAVVRRGARGSILFTGEKRLEYPAFHVDVVDTVGAGDVFNAGFIAALLHEHDLSTALQWGNAVAGYTISREGARTSPTLEQMKQFMSTEK